ncbi:hypothetical protein AXF42_Ash010638 [Apostasia shenzhenica]|uniref:Uncharacterized protein n=1 Tax=Apostasia shenzhenica TaxID=1088818 RepID=A0A2I0A6N6_9ASPA|nr:hypothetical protein AXF42_Ash010638 [Apostasia shenzhenica]
MSARGLYGRDRDTLVCYCWGTFVDPDNAAPSNLVFAMDQLLLMFTALLAYSAGAIPSTWKNVHFKRDTIKEVSDSSSFTPYGRSELDENMPTSSTNDLWGEVNGKLVDALEAMASDSKLDNHLSGLESDCQRYALSIFALSHGPMWRLLQITLWRLEKEAGIVSDIQSSHEVHSQNAWLVVVLEVLKGVIEPICTKWLEAELLQDTGNCNMNFVTSLSEKFKENGVVMQTITRCGKTDLYADLLFFLRFSSLRTGFCFGTKFLTEHGVEILEDLVITLADVVASIFLELISVDSDIANELYALVFKICPLSTRAIQRLRNEVVLKQWLQQNFESVIALYEDRFMLFVLSSQIIERPVVTQSENSIWQKLLFRKRAKLCAFSYVKINPVFLTVKRMKELQALSGWRYYFSLILEFSDVAMPLARAVFEKARNAVSFFLTCMIGRSLGLIFSGIRQSLGWNTLHHDRPSVLFPAFELCLEAIMNLTTPAIAHMRMRDDLFFSSVLPPPPPPIFSGDPQA